MAIKNKDGSSYSVFSFPNPIVKDQDFWDEKKLIFHNRCGQLIVFAASEEVTEPECSREPTFLEALKEADEPKPKEIKPRPKNIVIIHCLPAVYVTKKDDLYGDAYTRKSWGNKITFEGVITSIEDLTMDFWTTYQVSEGSIVYPARYAQSIDGKESLEERRWWKISQVKEKEGGFIVRCVPSIDQPDFSG